MYSISKLCGVWSAAESQLVFRLIFHFFIVALRCKWYRWQKSETYMRMRAFAQRGGANGGFDGAVLIISCGKSDFHIYRKRGFSFSHDIFLATRLHYLFVIPLLHCLSCFPAWRKLLFPHHQAFCTFLSFLLSFCCKVDLSTAVLLTTATSC